MDLPNQVAQAQKEAEDLIEKMQAPKEEPKEEPRVVSDDPNSETWKSRYEVLNGKYNAEIVPLKDNVDILNRLKHELRTTQASLRQATQNNDENARLISELRADLEKKKPETPVEIPASWDQVLTEEEREVLSAQDLDGETLKVLTKIMDNVVARKVPNYEDKFKEIDQKVQDVDNRFVQTVQQSWDEKIRATIVNSEKYFGDNADPGFVNWLEMPVTPEADITNRDILQKAINNQDLTRVKQGIKRFEESIAPTPQQQRNPLESRIEPSERFHGNDQPTTKGGETYTQAEVDKFYIDQTKGLWRGREKEAAILNNKYLIAAQKGRIRP